MIENDTFQHYQVLRRADGSLWELGRGAMGVTFKAKDTSLQRAVALKVIRAEALHNGNAGQRFVREARAAAGLNHPNVARVYHLGESAQSYFYAMEFIDGETLEARVRRLGPLPPRMALDIAFQVADALRAASKEGLVHRDIKPSNVMLLHEEEPEGEPHAKVIDFGLAKAAGRGGEAERGEAAAATITVAGFVGTPHYASPEQLDERDVDIRSDFYSLGVTLWYVLAGKPPFSGSVVQVMNQHLSRQPPFDVLRGVPAGVVSLLRRLLEKDPERRPQDAGELRREIEKARRGCGNEHFNPRPEIISTGASGRRIEPETAFSSFTTAPSPRKGGSGWRKFAVTVLLLIGFVLIASLFALSTWYVLGPELKPRSTPKSNPRKKVVSPTPGTPQGTGTRHDF